MARRHRSSPAEDFFESVVDLSSVLPWWFTLPTATLLYIFVPFDLNITAPTNSSEMVSIIIWLFVQATFKYMIPLALVIGAIISIISKIKSVLLFSDISKSGASNVISKLSWQDFEFLLSEWFKKQGYATEITGGGGADGGIDIKLFKDGKTSLVQCKHYKVWKVSVHIVREFYGIVTAEKATEGYIVTSGRFTKGAHAFAKGKNIHLLDGRDLVKMFDVNDISTANNLINEAMACPKCGGQLIEKSDKFGRFPGCENYPKCTYTKDICK